MLIAMAVYDTEENERTKFTKYTLNSLGDTVDFGKHHLIISDNGSCSDTLHLYDLFGDIISRVIYNGENIGTANAINRAWSYRLRGEHAVKMDNDVVIHQPHWADWMEEVFDVEPQIGICGLKRKDLEESPHTNHEFYHSVVSMLPHEKGRRWLIVEDVKHVFGTCQAYSSDLLGKIGYLVQPGVYGFDDALASARAHKAGFRTVFLHGFEIDHIDPGIGEYTQWKRDQAGMYMRTYHRMRAAYEAGEPVFYDGGSMLKEYTQRGDT